MTGLFREKFALAISARMDVKFLIMTGSIELSFKMTDDGYEEVLILCWQNAYPHAAAPVGNQDNKDHVPFPCNTYA